MKTATISELKQELQTLAPGRLLELCLRLTKYKKENKELLTYLLFEAADEHGYIKGVKSIMEDDFAGLPKANLYLIKKSLRKTLRTTNKFIKYTGSRQTEAELLIYYCTLLKQSGIAIHKSNALGNLYQQQIKKIQAALSTLHEDLQHDYTTQLSKIY